MMWEDEAISINFKSVSCWDREEKSKGGKEQKREGDRILRDGEKK